MDISDVSKYGCLEDGYNDLCPTPPTSRELLQSVCDAIGFSYEAVKAMDMGERNRAVEKSLGINFIENTRLQRFLRRHGVRSMKEYQEKVFNGDIRREDHYH